MQNALIGGAQEMMVGSTATLVGIVSDFGVYDLPFVFGNEARSGHHPRRPVSASRSPPSCRTRAWSAWSTGKTASAT
jgi:hypothetical protein